MKSSIREASLKSNNPSLMRLLTSLFPRLLPRQSPRPFLIRTRAILTLPTFLPFQLPFLNFFASKLSVPTRWCKFYTRGSAVAPTTAQAYQALISSKTNSANHCLILSHPVPRLLSMISKPPTTSEKPPIGILQPLSLSSFGFNYCTCALKTFAPRASTRIQSPSRKWPLDPPCLSATH